MMINNEDGDRYRIASLVISIISMMYASQFRSFPRSCGPMSYTNEHDCTRASPWLAR
jgi:hypothetical protein